MKDETVKKPRRVLIGPKVDLDTAGAALILGVTREDEVEVIRSGQASPEDLEDPNVICIEVGGSGQADKLNFDHHGPEAEGLSSASMQALGRSWWIDVHAPFPEPIPSGHDDKEAYEWHIRAQVMAKEAGAFVLPRRNLETEERFSDSISKMEHGCPGCVSGSTTPHWHPVERDPRGGGPPILLPDSCEVPEDRLVDYIDRLDTMGGKGVRFGGFMWDKLTDGPPFLSDVFAGMLLTERDPVEQLHCGVVMLYKILWRGIDPFGRMPVEEIPEWEVYAEAKAKNNRRVAEAVKHAQRETTQDGHKLAYLETDFFGAPGALYGQGAEVVVAYSPQFGNPPVPKFTVAGNGVRVDVALPALNALEEGWGGPPTGTIIGSPRSGSKLTLEQVVEVVREYL